MPRELNCTADQPLREFPHKSPPNYLEHSQLELVSALILAISASLPAKLEKLPHLFRKKKKIKLIRKALHCSEKPACKANLNQKQ